MSENEPYIYLALTRPEVEYLSDQTSAQKPLTRDLAVRLAGALVELAAVDALRVVHGLTVASAEATPAATPEAAVSAVSGPDTAEAA
ncbi:MAG: hypothetical protein M3Y74_22660 [Chloroflexota bacterium]|nr:hypothetical protein [Chloroflexota bacterium]